jgi:hypothetical protein
VDLLAKLTVTGVDDWVLKRFKQLVIARYGTLRGHLGEALTEAMMLWISREENEGREGCVAKR